MEYVVHFQSHHKKVTMAANATILDAAAKAGIALESNCGGAGKCGKCKVRVIEGLDPTQLAAGEKFFTTAQREEGYVLACKYVINSDLVVDVPKQQDAFARKTQLKPLLDNIHIDPVISKTYLELPKPSLEDQTPDFERVVRELGLDIAAQKPSRPLLHILPQRLREAKFKVTAVVRDDQLIWLEAGDTTQAMYGLVFDIGTTTVVGLLIDLYTGEIIGAAAATNPQNVYGADVISRIGHITETKGTGLADLNEKIVTCLDKLTAAAIADAGVVAENVYEATVVGNTTMNELFVNVDATYLAPAPFIPAYCHSVEIDGRELGIAPNPVLRLTVLPNIAGYVGADTVGVILGTHLHEKPAYTVAIDVGTNGEIMLAGNGRVLTCSTAAGPAFEGAQIKYGMRAADGAIETVAIDNSQGTVEFDVIGQQKPRGICGSGLVDAIAQMYQAGILNKTGAFNYQGEAFERLHPALQSRVHRLEEGDSIRYEFVLCPKEEAAIAEDIVITIGDVREMQLAKSAIYTGMKVLLGEMGATFDDVQEALIAGAFGSYIRVESALAIGLFPKLKNGRILSIGNAASEGARLALVSRQERALCQKLARESRYIELSTRLDFQMAFVEALGFPDLD